jgi:hypothetical protein
VSNARFFVGTVALLNSLRLTGTDAPLTILDVGLTTEQRARLEPHADVRARDEFGSSASSSPHAAKPLAGVACEADVVVVIDGDMIVTGPLDDLVGIARSGQIVVLSDGPRQPLRRFQEWEGTFRLEAPLRQGETYVNSGIVALSQTAWPTLLRRWAAMCERLPPDLPEQRERYHQIYGSWPFADYDQDALNALLMSEVPPSSTHVLPYWSVPFPQDMTSVELLDMSTLRCTARGHIVRALHYGNRPKPWDPWGWTRAGDQAFVSLLPRVVLAADVTVRLAPSEIPRWLASPLLRRATQRSMPILRRSARSLTRVLPGSRARIRRLTGRV